MNNRWVIPPPGTTCENCGHDLSAHTGPCITLETLKNALGDGESRVEATVNGVTLRVEQYINPFTSTIFWLWGNATSWEECDVRLDYADLEDGLLGHDFDPESLIWQKLTESTHVSIRP